ncbi:MAG: hypothetical protein M3220_06600 [Chloroflexota bacterium]|nr:hypothetical protein [Chloroflexota bacterium]
MLISRVGNGAVSVAGVAVAPVGEVGLGIVVTTASVAIGPEGVAVIKAGGGAAVVAKGVAAAPGSG